MWLLLLLVDNWLLLWIMGYFINYIASGLFLVGFLGVLDIDWQITLFPIQTKRHANTAIPTL